MRVLACDRGNVLAEFQHVLRGADPAFHIDVETDAYRAVELAAQTHPDIVVTEIDLSGITGVELVRRFRAAHPGTRVIVWTNQDSADVALACLGAGAAGYLLKSERQERVIAAVEAARHGVVSLSPRITDLLSQREARSRLRELELEDGLAVSAAELERITTAKAEFLSNVSHELRTPVTVAKGISHVLANRNVEEAERSQFLTQLDASLDKLMGIVDGILTIAESERGDLTLDVAAFDLIPVVRGIAEEAERRYPEIHIEATLPAQLQTSADRAKLSEVVRHLLDNACRYSPPNGTVELRARAQSEGTVVSVIDQGEGILREVVSRAFDEPFSTGEAILRKEKAGAGLGLHMARRLVVEHGGVMWADPLPGGGTRVSFCIPAHVGDTLNTPPASPEDPATPPQRAGVARAAPDGTRESRSA